MVLLIIGHLTLRTNNNTDGMELESHPIIPTLFCSNNDQDTKNNNKSAGEI
ncbi:MAG TPA: hypothetical protein VFG90_06780 [Nitrososphaeraceae archaeon]|nr:hypothetical protein [Nitrososphaeraceae archaeon]